MRFLVDECTGPGVARWLRRAGHDAASVYDRYRGIDDEDILKIAVVENRIVVTNDKDFGERIFRDRHAHRGVILLRLADERTVAAVAALRRLLDYHASSLADRFVVITEETIRFARRTEI